jgi:hypothetical protein
MPYASEGATGDKKQKTASKVVIHGLIISIQKKAERETTSYVLRVFPHLFSASGRTSVL